HVTRRVERHFDVTDASCFAIRNRFDARRGIQPRTQQRQPVGGGEISRAATARMIAMRMRDERALDRPPRIYVETAGLAIEAGVGHAQRVRQTRSRGTRDQANAGPGSVLRPGAMSLCPTTSSIG